MENLTDAIIFEDDDHQHHLHDHEEGSSDGVLVAKIVTLCVLFSASFLMGTSPLYISKLFKWNLNVEGNKVVIRMLCFGGGVLLCTTFLHLLPEIQESITKLQEDGSFYSSEDYEIHFAPLLMICGFFILYLVEEAVHGYLHSKETKDNLARNLNRTFSIRKLNLTTDDDEKKQMEATNVNTNNNNNKVEEECIVDVHSHVDHSHINFDSSFLKSFRGFFIVLALSVHELFEGLAVGLESTTSSVWYMFAAVSAHKIIIAFCIGVELIVTDISKLLTVLYIFTFAIVSPIGIAVGILLSEDQQTSTEVASVILQGLASGTLLYIVFFEILRTDRKGGLKTFCSVFLGFAVMFCITAFIPHGHSHSHCH